MAPGAPAGGGGTAPGGGGGTAPPPIAGAPAPAAGGNTDPYDVICAPGGTPIGPPAATGADDTAGAAGALIVAGAAAGEAEPIGAANGDAGV
ncbi:hypothetical protein H7J87_27965 [Mycolicibacterium wolinskyi]|uniref:hypothetical protein n=1 Tax=Mycolicibacterium TaxID=1866885 RepID=UPI0013FE1666|nr:MULTISPECIES: hypothetical protein [Mycolicibacterium]MCV7289169.1 hypothetical protein [Mycolicibacterium wolinskyi]MCV7297330.1 hypothetical protein [Mycolicibacterium goodii]